MTSQEPRDSVQSPTDDILDRWLAERADEVGVVGVARSRVEVSSEVDDSFDPDPWGALTLPGPGLTQEQQEFLGALEQLPDLLRGADLVDRPPWDLDPTFDADEAPDQG